MIRTKAHVSTAELGDQYCMIGPYNEACVRLEVEVMEPEFSVLKEVITSLRSQGFKVRDERVWDEMRGLWDEGCMG